MLQRRAQHLGVGIFFGTFIAGSIPRIAGVLDFLKWVSPINYVMPGEVVMDGLNGGYVLILAAVMASAGALTYIAYSRRDLIG